MNQTDNPLTSCLFSRHPRVPHHHGHRDVPGVPLWRIRRVHFHHPKRLQRGSQPLPRSLIQLCRPPSPPTLSFCFHSPLRCISNSVLPQRWHAHPVTETPLQGRKTQTRVKKQELDTLNRGKVYWIAPYWHWSDTLADCRNGKTFSKLSRFSEELTGAGQSTTLMHYITPPSGEAPAELHFFRTSIESEPPPRLNASMLFWQDLWHYKFCIYVQHVFVHLC